MSIRKRIHNSTRSGRMLRLSLPLHSKIRLHLELGKCPHSMRHQMNPDPSAYCFRVSIALRGILTSSNNQGILLISSYTRALPRSPVRSQHLVDRRFVIVKGIGFDELPFLQLSIVRGLSRVVDTRFLGLRIRADSWARKSQSRVFAGSVFAEPF